MIIGHFATHEYDQYIRIEADMNKRIIQIVKERIYSNMGELMGKSWPSKHRAISFPADTIT